MTQNHVGHDKVHNRRHRSRHTRTTPIAGLLGEVTDNRLAVYVSDGLHIGGWRAEIVPNEPWPLQTPPLQDCLRGDALALSPPPGGR